MNSRDPVKFSGPNRKSFCLDPKESLFKPTIELQDIKNVHLRHIFQRELEELKQALEAFKELETTTVKMFKYEVMLCFWFAIHCEYVKEAQLIYKVDHIIESIMKNLRAEGEDIINLKRYDDKKRARRLEAKRAQIIQNESIRSDDDKDDEEDEYGSEKSKQDNKEGNSDDKPP